MLLTATVAVILAPAMGGCRPADYRRDADRVAYAAIARQQQAALGRTEPFTIETPADTLRRRLLLDQELPRAGEASLGAADVQPIAQWPDDDYLTQKATDNALADGFDTAETVRLTLGDALQIGAHGSREYQAQKEQVFQAALRLDLEHDAFRRTWAGALQGEFRSSLEREVALDDKGHTDRQTVSGLEYGTAPELSQRFRNGMTFAGQLGVDFASLLTQDRAFSRGIFADVTITIPLLRGAGEFVVTEPLTQAERDVVYAIYEFERYKRDFAVATATEYFAVLRQLDALQNAEENYRRLIASTRRARRLADAGRLPEIQVDQSQQDELRARNQWVSAQEAYERAMDSFKLTLGLPTDALIELDRSELERLTAELEELFLAAPLAEVEEEIPAADAPIELSTSGGGPRGRFELDERAAILTALEHRLDLRVAVGRVFDAQRTVAVAADQLRADVTLLGRGSAGARRTLESAGQRDAILRPDEGQYSALLTIDLPFERTAERNTYRATLIRLEQAVRDAQALEDRIKLDVRNGLSRREHPDSGGGRAGGGAAGGEHEPVSGGGAGGDSRRAGGAGRAGDGAERADDGAGGLPRERAGAAARPGRAAGERTGVVGRVRSSAGCGVT
jgi:outer membrane protein TolC